LVLELSGSPLRDAVVEEVRTIFERRNDETIYIPVFYPTIENTA